MTTESEMWGLVTSDPTVQALVGDRIYPGRLPTDPTLPAVTYRLISSPRIQTQTGPAFAQPRYRWDCWSLVYDEAVAVAIAIAIASGGFKAWVDDEGDHPEEATGLFRRRLETRAFTKPEERP